MIAAHTPVQRPRNARLLVVDAHGRVTHAPRSRFIAFLKRGDLVIANDAATIPASLRGSHVPSGDQVEVRLGDGSLGDPAGAPWDGILVAAAAPAIPVSLREQLSPNGGRLVIPVGDRRRQDLLLVIRQGDTWLERNDGPCVFVPLVGEEGFPG